PPERLMRPRDDRVQRPRRPDKYVNGREPRISRAAVRPRNVRAPPAQQKQSDHGKRIRQHHSKNHVRVQLVVAPAQGKHPCPYSLPNETEDGSPPFGMDHGHTSKEAPSLRNAQYNPAAEGVEGGGGVEPGDGIHQGSKSRARRG